VRHNLLYNQATMKKILLLPCFFLYVLSQAQDKTPTPDEVRMAIAKSITDLQVAPEPVALVTNDFVTSDNGSIPIRIYQPALGKPLPVIYLVHGAAWVAGDLETHDNICRYLTNHLQAVVVAVNYRRPPEHTFPAPFDDSYTVLKWVNANTKKLNGNGKLVLIGDSAGGQLVGSLCMVNAAGKKPIPVVAQVLVNPALNLSKGSVSYTTYSRFIDWYLNDTDDTKDIRISPALATIIKGVPPAIIVVGENDKIRNDGEVFHQKLLSAGINSKLYVQPNTGHLAGRWCAGDEKAKPTMDFVVAELQRVLADRK
jgi:acetyl esterase